MKPEGLPIKNINKVPVSLRTSEQLRQELAELRNGPTTPEDEKRVDEISDELNKRRDERKERLDQAA